MPFTTRPLTRVSIACAATALALSACTSKNTTENPTTPTPPTSASTPAAASTETTPAPGEWTLEDLKVGAKVPKEDLERLFPKWEVPEPPATLTEFSEQGAKDAAIYYDRLLDAAFYNDSPELINTIDGGECENCPAMRDFFSNKHNLTRYATPFSLESAIVTQNPDNHEVYEINIQLRHPAVVQVDKMMDAIKTFNEDIEEVNFAYVTFLEGRWTPLLLKLDRSHL